MSDPEIKPALSAEEWARREFVDGDGEGARLTDEGPELIIACGCAAMRMPKPAAVAALALQRAAPDGGPLFTWRDVDALRAVTELVEMEWGPGSFETFTSEALRDLAARLASLLPPRTEEK